MRVAQKKHPISNRRRLSLSPDLVVLAPPFASSVNDESGSPLGHLPSNLSWSELALAANVYVPSIPATFHSNGPKEYLNDRWPKMWNQPYARPLLKQSMDAAAAEMRTTWDRRGGRGGAWNDGGQWMNWLEVCGGYEDEIFRDGKGPWGGEDGDGRPYEAFGGVITDLIIRTCTEGYSQSLQS
ncbi:MAG: hypothetical protein M1837_003724 [Sclerophora amabilis]|nr:MAG: hypothetical protein M1837_003724 [Sclerophora amabilis]